MKREHTRVVLTGCLLWGLACAGTPKAPEIQPPTKVPEVHPGILQGYLATSELPYSLGFVLPPPAEGSPELAQDEVRNQTLMTLRGTPRWALAERDAHLSFPAAAEAFSCALGTEITEAETPHLYMLLRRSLADAGLATYSAKNHYQRKRPFLGNGQPICTPDEAEFLKTDGSFPSGHTAIGWAWALILSEVAPERATEILARGRAFGESREVCNVHWQSDVEAGRLVGAAAVARLHINQVFLSELALVRAEFEKARKMGVGPRNDCSAETQALGLRTGSAQP